MIEGLKIEVKSAELKEHLQGRAKFHDEKSKFYSQQLVEFKEANKNLPEELQTNNVSNRGPLMAMEGRVSTHKKTADLFKFLADHVIADEVYHLTEHDLQRIEITPNYYGESALAAY